MPTIARIQGAGTLYRAVRERFSDAVQVRVVDPRNLPALLPILLREFRRHRVPVRAALKTLFGLSVTTVVVNGRLFSRGEWPSAGRLNDELSQASRRMF